MRSDSMQCDVVVSDSYLRTKLDKSFDRRLTMRRQTSTYIVIVAYTRSSEGVTLFNDAELCSELSQAASNLYICL